MIRQRTAAQRCSLRLTRRISVSAPRLYALRFLGGRGTKAQYGQKADINRCRLRRPTKTHARTLGVADTPFVSVAPDACPSDGKGFRLPRPARPGAKRKTSPTRGPTRKWRQPRGTGTKLATRLSARTESWSTKKNAPARKLFQWLSCYPPPPVARWTKERCSGMPDSCARGSVGRDGRSKASCVGMRRQSGGQPRPSWSAAAVKVSRACGRARRVPGGLPLADDDPGSVGWKLPPVRFRGAPPNREPEGNGQLRFVRAILIGVMKYGPNWVSPMRGGTHPGQAGARSVWRRALNLPHPGENEGPIPPVDRPVLPITERRDWGRG